MPTVASLFFSLTRWTLFDAEFIGLANFVQFFQEPFLVKGLINTLIYGVVTSLAKVVLGLLLAVLLTSDIVARGYLRSVIFFPVLVSTVGVGITFTVMMHPTQGFINETIALFGVKGPQWLSDPRLVLLSVAFVDVWKGVGLATVIYMAGDRLDPAGFLRSIDHRRRHGIAALLEHHSAAGAAGNRHRRAAQPYRRAALVRSDLGHDQGRARVHLRQSSPRWSTSNTRPASMACRRPAMSCCSSSSD